MRNVKAKILSGLIIVLVLLFFSQSNKTQAENSGFVYREGEHFELGEEAFYFSSSNQYYLFYKPDFMIDEVLEDAQALGMKVFRTWGFCEGIWKDGYCFQPNPGEYHELTFQKMDYIIDKANQCGIRLIIPLVNNWDDNFGGMEQYARWSASAKANLTFDLYNPGGSCSAALAVRTGDNWDWHESEAVSLETGWNSLFFDLSASTWRKAPDWEPIHPISDLDDVKQLDIGLYDYTQPGSVYIDNICLGPAGNALLWDGAEEIGGWLEESSWSDALDISLSEDYVTQGTYSFKVDYDFDVGSAFWKLETGMGNHDCFYVDEYCKQLYKVYVEYFLNRENSITGTVYKDDPSILMWELANEPRCQSDPSGDILQAWLEEMAEYIKSIDSNHLVSGGGEGWYGVEGVDYIRNNQSEFIDACSFHLFPNDNYMSEYDAEVWIRQHVNDAKQIIEKPVYLGEFGWKVDRDAERTQEVLLYDFVLGVENWYIHWGYEEGPFHADSPCYNEAGAIKYTTSFDNGTTAGGAVWCEESVDLSGYEYLSGWVRTPDAPEGTWFELQVYTKSGPEYAETWSSTPVTGYLSPNSWYQAKLAVSEIVGPADPSEIWQIGIQIKSFNSSYSGDVYYDLIEAYTGSDQSYPTQMAVRNRIYDYWCSLVNDTNCNGGGFWLLSGHDETGELYPDYYNYAVYYPEDSQTCSIIQDFSASMNDKLWARKLAVPWYEEEHSYYSAAASAKMALDYIREDTILTQDELYTYGHANNNEYNEDILDIDPQGLAAVMNNYDPARYYFSIRELDSAAELMRDICHWIDYEVPGMEMANTPVLVPTYGGYDNWMAAIGGVASMDPLPDPENPFYTPDFTVYGLYFNDPAVDGIGAVSYKTANESEATYLLELDTREDPWDGKYVCVVEPPELLSSAKVLVAGPGISKATEELVNLASLSVEYLSQDKKLPAEIQNKLKAFSWEEIIGSALLKDEEFALAFQGSFVKEIIPVTRIDKNNGDYYLISFGKPVSAGVNSTFAVIIIDKEKGYFKEASWCCEPVKYLPVSKKEAINLALAKHSSFSKFPADEEIITQLIWEPVKSSSPYYPVWKIKIGAKTWFVYQDGRVEPGDAGEYTHE